MPQTNKLYHWVTVCDQRNPYYGRVGKVVRGIPRRWGRQQIQFGADGPIAYIPCSQLSIAHPELIAERVGISERAVRILIDKGIAP